MYIRGGVCIFRTFYKLPLQPFTWHFLRHFDQSGISMAFCCLVVPFKLEGLTTLNKLKSWEVSTNDRVITQNIFNAAQGSKLAPSGRPRRPTIWEGRV